MSGDSVVPASTTPYTSFPPSSHGIAFDGSSFETQSTPIIGLAPSPTNHQVWQDLKSLLEVYLIGEKLSFEKQFQFGQWAAGVEAQRALAAECISGSHKLGREVQGHQTRDYLVVGLVDAIGKILQAALNVDLQVLRCLISRAHKQRKRNLCSLQNQCSCTKARLRRLCWNSRSGNMPEIYKCVCKQHADIPAIAIGHKDGALEMQKTFEECRERFFETAKAATDQLGL